LPLAVNLHFQLTSLAAHWELTSSPSTIHLYSKELATCLSASWKVATLLVREQRSYHPELINAQHLDSCIYSLGNIVFARCVVKSDSSQGQFHQVAICIHRAMAHLSYP
jgi:hypothetical protein